MYERAKETNFKLPKGKDRRKGLLDCTLWYYSRLWKGMFNFVVNDSFEDFGVDVLNDPGNWATFLHRYYYS